MPNQMAIGCICGKQVTLEIIAGQYQDEYRGDCECGWEWFLKELSEVLAEISDEE